MVTIHFIRKYVDSDGSSDDFLHVWSNDGNFTHNPKYQSGNFRVVLVAHLSKMLTSDNAQS